MNVNNGQLINGFFPSDLTDSGIRIVFTFNKDSALGYLDGKAFEVDREIGVGYEKDRT